MIGRALTFRFRRRAAYGAVLAALLLGFTTSLAAAPLEFDLGEGLGYFRAHALPADLPPAATPSRPLVLDLRFSHANENAANALEAWIKFRASATKPVFVLVNSATPAVFDSVLAACKSQPGFLTLGAASSAFTPDLLVATDVESERRAYDALEHGTTVEALTRQNTDKPRNDEASLMHDRTAGAEDAAEESPPDLSDRDEEIPAPSPAKPPALIDYTLQQAIQVHRALLALKRL